MRLASATHFRVIFATWHVSFSFHSFRKKDYLQSYVATNYMSIVRVLRAFSVKSGKLKLVDTKHTTADVGYRCNSLKFYNVA